jgi:putative aminopeptidase FrvX
MTPETTAPATSHYEPMHYLQQLSEAIGVSGEEDAVRDVVLNAIDGYAEQIRIDPMGSITALKPGTGDAPRLKLMIDAHMDEIGFMVTGFDGEGLIRFTNVGGVDDRILPGLRVLVGKDKIPGVILWKPIHQGNDQNVVAISNLRIDIGAKDKAGVEGKVKRGDRIAFSSQFMVLGDQVVRGKAFDDRVGCSLLIDILRGGPYPVDLVAAFTVQEEIGLRGATVAAQALQPDFGLALEGTTGQDTPNPLAEEDDTHEYNPTCRMGGGPVISVMDRSMITNPKLVTFLRETAEANGIPYQYKTQLGGGTDAGAIHQANAGIPSMVLSMPCRYIHSPVAYLNRQDYRDMLRLITAVIEGLPALAERFYA